MERWLSQKLIKSLLKPGILAFFKGVFAKKLSKTTEIAKIGNKKRFPLGNL
ncbi:MAG: hypothetical protein Q7S45_02905 [Candidatus Curtissbacteria bacterium]|nr:hypothetical protein [Candidatus Curtissbacteria bacterium]